MKIKLILNVTFVPADYVVVCAVSIVIVGILYLFLAIRCDAICVFSSFFLFLIESFGKIHLVLVGFFQWLAISDHVGLAVEVDH